MVVSASEYGGWRRTSGVAPWYLSSSSGASSIRGYDNNGWKSSYSADEDLHSKSTSTQIRVPQLIEDGELLWAIKNVLEKVGSKVDMNDMGAQVRSVWENIRNGPLGEQIETLLQQPQEGQSQRNRYEQTWR